LQGKMLPIKKILKDFSKLSSSESVGAAIKVMEQTNVEYLLIEEEEGEIKGMVTPYELVGYPSSRLILDSVIQPVGSISEEALADEALKVLEGKKVSFLLVLNKEGMPVGVVNREIIINSLFQELKKLNKEKDKYIAKLKRTEEALQVSRESFHNIVERSADGIIVADREGVARFVNTTLKSMFGRKAEELLGELFGFPIMASESMEIDIVRRVGEIGVGEMRVTETEWDGENAYLISIRDITERKRFIEATKASLREKEVLLKEIHHRVKNNLQILSSLLNLQSEHIEDEQALEAFKISQNRINSMALIHEELYQSEDLENIDFAGYIRRLVTDLYGSYGVDSETIKLNLNAENILLGINKAIPCGLIINELVSNSIKHAFPQGKVGEISISFHSDSDTLTLRFSDNGVGFPKDLDFRATRSLGMQLVTTLIKQLDGSIELDRSAGTTFTISFTK